MTIILPPVTDTIVALLGGKQVITSQVRNNLDLMQAAQAGVPVAAVRHLQKHLRFTNREMSEALSISESTLARREQAHGILTRDEGEKAIQLSALVAHGLEVFEDEGDFNHWLHTTNVALGGIQPYSLLASALGREQVRMLLFRIQHGIYS